MDVCEDQNQINDEGYNDMEDDGYDADMDCPTDSEEPLEVAMMYLDIGFSKYSNLPMLCLLQPTS